jgi:diguanylate cyclase (GGDEF)-like protein
MDAILAAPVMAGEQVLAVLELALRQPEPEDQHLIRLVSAAATQLGSIIQRKRAEERLTYLAHYDLLTGLPNRVLFNDRLRQALVEAFRHSRLVGVAFVDLDRFKTINDSLGHEVGDRFLKAVAERLQRCVRDGDTVARLSGDEFTLILADMAQAEDAARVARKIVACFDQPFNVGGRDVYSSVSLGMALCPFDESTPEGLLRNADSAMYRAKQAGGNAYQFFRQEMTSKAAENLALENGLRRALDRSELLLHYQPKAALASGRLSGFEALIRWQPDVAHQVSPVRFVSVAEEIGLIGPIGEWVLRTACKQASTWQAAGLGPVRVAVNLSPRQVLQPLLAQSVSRVLDEARLPARCLELEITETLLMQHSREVVCALQDLKSLGVKLVLDDFGTGYSSLAYLKRFPVDALKIDQSFVQEVLSDSEDAAIVSAIIAMAHSLGLQVVAEGVETAGQLEFLRDKGCDEAQGFLLGQPLPATDTAALLAGTGPLAAPATPS